MLDRVSTTTAQLRAAISAKDQFLRYVFHEMRVPLNAVHLAVDELAADAHDHDVDSSTRSLLDIAVFQVTAHTDCAYARHKLRSHAAALTAADGTRYHRRHAVLCQAGGK
jgi:hypothetical protein